VNHAARLRSSTLGALAQAWRGVDLTDRSAEEFTVAAGQLADAAQEQMAAATVAFLAGLHRSVAGGRPGQWPPVGGAMHVATAHLRGRETAEVWNRPVQRMRRALGDGHSPEAAWDIGAGRIRELAATGLQLAHVRAALVYFAAAPAVETYRRSLNGACGLCVLASTVEYQFNEPMPIHPHCGCVVWPTFAGVGPLDPGGGPGAEAARAAVVDLTGSSDISPEAFVRHVTVHDHGEIGPVLRRAGDRFTELSELAV
jgi:hypothetical protein